MTKKVLREFVEFEAVERHNIITEEKEELADQVHELLFPIAVVQIQRSLRAYLVARQYRPRYKAAALLRRVARGYYFGRRVLLCLKNGIPVEIPSFGSVDAKQRSPKRASPIVGGAFVAVVILQRWMRKRLRRVRQLQRDEKIEEVLLHATRIQSRWRGYKVRCCFNQQIQRIRWQRQMVCLRRVLCDLAIAPAARHVQSMISQVGETAPHESEKGDGTITLLASGMLPIDSEDSGDDVFDPAEDEAFFQSCLGVSKADVRFAANTHRMNYFTMPLRRCTELYDFQAKVEEQYDEEVSRQRMKQLKQMAAQRQKNRELQRKNRKPRWSPTKGVFGEAGHNSTWTRLMYNQ